MCTRVFALLALQVGWSHCFSWNNVVGGEHVLEFYNDGTLTYIEDISLSRYVRSITYAPVHYRLLFAYQHTYSSSSSFISISSFDLSTKKALTLYTTKTTEFRDQSLAYDPVTQLLFWSEGYTLYSFSLKPTTSNKALEINLLLKLNKTYFRDVAVDSCGGYIYWITDHEIERVRFDGSGREVVINSTAWYRSSFAIDEQTKKMYWSEKIKISNDKYQMFIKCADLNGRNRKTLYTSSDKYAVTVLTVSKDFVYWKTLGESTICQIPKNPPHDVKPKVFPISNGNCWHCQAMATNYTIKEQIQGTKSCEALKWLDKENTHGSAESCDASVCHNYCFQGDCSINAEGKPKCRCNDSYAGERCEVNACHKHCLNDGVCSLNEEDGPACECTTGFKGERCEVSVCKDFCFQGDCSVSAEGLPKCRCNDSYAGKRCEVNACHKHCLNDGVCSLTEEDEPACQCTTDFKGERCEVSVCKDFCFQGDCSVSAEGLPKCRCTDGYSGEKCEIKPLCKQNSCHEYCLNNGVCSLNKQDEPVCQCTGDFEGKRCDVPAFMFQFIETVSLWRGRLHKDDTLVTPLPSKAVKTTSTSVITKSPEP